ncbi:conserved hypothetical protein [Rhodococcus phage E3]|uniref:hypothetical protein n=1 Tax=Rhodococcus phage E3 TaxID=1007869 RepID=UPI0002C6C504|nr:hypothetical protein M176_gp155 [Rhodococcus phage E3]AEQ21063.1 conserved hypothetical protein [Rhodococcus phage E3]
MTHFDEMDPVEQMIGKPVTKMTGDELISYIKTYMQAMHGVDLGIDGVKERSVMTALRRIYKDDAGRIVKWVMTKRSGRDQKDELVTYFSFQRADKWWLDKIHIEMQVHQNRSRELAAAPKLTPLSALLRGPRRAQS